MFVRTDLLRREIELVGDQPRLEVRLLGGVFAEVPQDARLFRGEAG